MKTSAELKHESHEAVGRMLNLLLADEYLLYQITRDYHWNVSGTDFFSRRLLFQLQHDAATKWVDEVTERIREMRLDARISWADLKESARCSAASGFGLAADSMLAELLRAHEDIIAHLRSDTEVCRLRFGDASTAGFLAGMIEQHENAAWMLRTQLDTPEVNPLQFSASLN